MKLKRTQPITRTLREIRTKYPKTTAHVNFTTKTLGSNRIGSTSTKSLHNKNQIRKLSRNQNDKKSKQKTYFPFEEEKIEFIDEYDYYHFKKDFNGALKMLRKIDKKKSLPKLSPIVKVKGYSSNSEYSKNLN